MDLATLLKFLQITYRELYPQQQEYQHLQSTVDRYFSVQTPLWFVTTSMDASETAMQPQTPDAELLQPPTSRDIKIACLWVGTAIDQISGIRHPNIFLIYVEPAYRRRGIGRALMQYMEVWAKAQGYQQIGLQVFTINDPAIELYRQLGYQPRSISMIREF